MKKVILPLLVMAAIILSWYLSQREKHRTAFAATLEADEARVAARVGGRVIAVLAEEGDELAPGQVLARLEAKELRARRDLAVAALEELEHGPRPQEIAAAKSEWEAAEAERVYARADAQRKDELYATDVIPVQDRDLARSRAEAAEKRMEAARERHALLQAGTRPEKIAQARAQLAELDAQISELDVKAPATAVLESLHVRPGDVLAPNTPVATLVLASPPWVRVYLRADRAGTLKVGDVALIRPDALPGVTATGRVEQIARKAEFTPRNVQTPEERMEQTFGIKVRIADAGGKVRAGMTAVVSFPDLPGTPP